jgi:hypothetical protein
MGVWQIGACHQGQNVKASKAMLTFVIKVGVSWHALFMWVQLAQGKTRAKDHHGDMGSLKHGRLGVQFPSSYHGPGCEVLGSKLGTNGTCLEATLGVTLQNPFGQLDVVMRWDLV